MKCEKCGALIPDDAVVCGRCGAPVENEMSDFNEETRVINQDELRAAASAGAAGEVIEGAGEIFDENEKKRAEQRNKMMEDKKKQLSEIERRRNEKRRRQRRRKAAIIAIICAALVAGAGIGVYYIANGLDNNNIKPTPAPSASAAVASPSPSASPSASPVASPSVSPSASPSVSPSASPSVSAPPASNGANTQGNGSSSQSWTPSSGSTSSSGSGTSGSGSSGSSQRTASNTGSQRSASISGNGSSSGGKSSASSTGGSSVASSQTEKATSSSDSSTASGSNAKSSPDVPDSGLVSEPISSRAVTGGEVIHNEGTGRYLMTFIMDGKRYYANVSEGSTTDQIKGKTFTIDAEATFESYGGNTVYEISSMTNSSGGYILENSSTELLSESDIAGMSKYDLALARNEIFARHGRKFQTAEYNRYFSSKSWYKINPNYNYSDENANLSDTEKKNVQLILEAERNK